MTLLPISGSAFEEYAETTCVLLREADGEYGIKDYGIWFADDSANCPEDA